MPIAEAFFAGTGALADHKLACKFFGVGGRRPGMVESATSIIEEGEVAFAVWWEKFSKTKSAGQWRNKAVRLGHPSAPDLERLDLEGIGALFFGHLDSTGRLAGDRLQEVTYGS